MRFTQSFMRRGAVAALLMPVLVPSLAHAQGLPDPKTLMETHNAALGGRAAIDKHTTMHMKATMLLPGMGSTPATLDVYRSKPNKFVQKVVIPQMGELLQGFDGNVTWATNPMAGAQLLDGEMAESIKSQADFSANFQDFSVYSKAETVELTDFEGRKCYKVKLARGTREAFEFFDASTGLLAGITGSAPGPGGRSEYTTVFLAYTEFSGIKFPSKVEQRGAGGGSMITFTAVEFDKVDPAVFELPASVKALVKP